MTVRFKSCSEYQKSYGSRSRSVSPQHYGLLAGLRSDQMGISREPAFQHRRRLGPAGLAQSCTFLLCPPDPRHFITEPSLHADRRAPHAASKSHSVHRKERPSVDPDPPTPAETGPPAGPRLAVEQRPDGKSPKPHPSNPNSQPQCSSPAAAADGPQPSTNEMLHSHSRFAPPFKKDLVLMQTEYQQNFRGLIPPTGPRLRKKLGNQRVPLFHTYRSIKRRKEVSHKILHPKHQRDNTTPPPPPSPQVHRRHRMLTEYESSFRSPLYRISEEGGQTEADCPQAQELRQQAQLYRLRAWGRNFSRDHLSQLQSEHNALWEPTDTTDFTTDPPTPNPVTRPVQKPDSHASPCVEALDLASRSSVCSKRSSVQGSSDRKMLTPPDAAAAAEDRSQAGGEEKEHEEEEEEKESSEEEGRLPTPRLKMRPVQRTHHDVTTPTKGGAILVGKLKSSDEGSPVKLQKCVVAVPGAALKLPIKHREAWQDNSSTHRSSGPAPDRHPSTSPPSKVIRMKLSPPTALPLPLAPPPQHCIQGTLRHPDFQHNGELGLRFRELQCSGGGCGSDEDDRLSVMSWRSAASCSMASAVLERAQKRRENFWGKR